MKWYANYLAVGNCVQVNFLFFSRALNHFPYSKASWTLLCWNPAWGLTSTIKLPSPGKSFDTTQLFLGNVLDINLKYHHLKDIWYVLAQLQVSLLMYTHICTYLGQAFQYFCKSTKSIFMHSSRELGSSSHSHLYDNPVCNSYPESSKPLTESTPPPGQHTSKTFTWTQRKMFFLVLTWYPLSWSHLLNWKISL